MLRIVPMYQGLFDFIPRARKQPRSDWANLWQQFVLAPYWDQWAAGQYNEARTRAEMSCPPDDLASLEQSAEALAKSSVEAVVCSAYKDICQQLPYHEGDVAICLMAVGAIQQDVVGTCIGSSTLLTIPAAQIGWQPWVKYVLAHERHHSAWGYHYYYIRGGQRRDLLVSLISEGSADSFAHSLCPDMHPQWVAALSPEEEMLQWQIIQPLLDIPDPTGSLHRRFFFGSDDSSTPASTGYTIGFHILQGYIKRHSAESVTEWTLKLPEEIFSESGYPGD
jgi:uncharacterized protein YjaZ